MRIETVGVQPCSGASMRSQCRFRTEASRAVATALFLAGIAFAPRTASAQFQPPNSEAPSVLTPYGAMVVPPDACVWANVIYSPGAIVPSQISNRYFKCVRGAWEAVTPAEAIIAQPPPQGPRPLRPPP